jgi:L-threonylcarbamoyladenylate synthase
VVIYPTETFYALGADPWNQEAMEALHLLKGRPPGKPFLLLIPDPSWAGRLWAWRDPLLPRLAERFWPGPLTLVGPAGPEAPPFFRGGTVGLRLPGCGECRRFLSLAGAPLTGTSANPAGVPPPVTAASAARLFPRGVGLCLDGGTLPGETASTVVEVAAGRLRVLREGRIPASLLREEGFPLEGE